MGGKRPWHIAARLLYVAKVGWQDLDGLLTAETGADIRTFEADRLCNTIELIVKRSFDDDMKRTAWVTKLYAPPKVRLTPAIKAQSDRVIAEQEGAAVLAFMAEQEAFKKQLGKG